MEVVVGKRALERISMVQTADWRRGMRMDMVFMVLHYARYFVGAADRMAKRVELFGEHERASSWEKVMELRKASGARAGGEFRGSRRRRAEEDQFARAAVAEFTEPLARAFESRLFPAASRRTR